MYKVSGTLNNSYGSSNDSENSRKTSVMMPTVTTGDKRLTNIQMANGEFVQGIRRNKEYEPSYLVQQHQQDHHHPSNELYSSSLSDISGIKPLRYTPGLSCDAKMEALRPERSTKHSALSGASDWKKKLIVSPNSYEGSFADADLSVFRPCGNRQKNEETSWAKSRLPEDSWTSPSFSYSYGPTASQSNDELSQIKMRNRRFANSCAQEASMGGHVSSNLGPFYGIPPVYSYSGYPLMMHPSGFPPQPLYLSPHGQFCPSQIPQMTPEAIQDNELAMLNQELNNTRRVTRPFVPLAPHDYEKLQKNIELLEQEQLTTSALRKPCEPIVSVDQLPPPKKIIKAPLTEASGIKSVRPSVNIADQIAIRSFVIGQNIPKIGRESKDATMEN